MTVFKFDGRLYTSEAIMAAAAAWKDVAEIRVRADGKWIVAECEKELRALDEDCGGDFAGEFSNQALWEMKR